MSGQNQMARDVDIDIGGLFQILRKKVWWLLAITLLSFIVLFIGLSFVSPRYEATTRVLIENRESVFTRNAPRDQGLSQSRFDKEAIGSQVEIMNSDTVILSVMKELKIASNKEYGTSKPSLMNDLKQLFNGKTRVSSASPEERGLKKFRGNLTIYSVADSRVIVIKFKSKDPELAKNVPNAIAQHYLKLQKSAQQDLTQNATEWLGPEVQTLRKRVLEAEQKVADYRASSDILDGNNNALLATQQLSEVSSELSRLRAQKASALAKVASIRSALQSGGSIDVIPEVISSPLVQRLRESEVALQAEISELSTTLLSGHPRLKALKSQVSNFQTQIAAAAKNILKSLENNVEFTSQQEQQLRAELNRLKSESVRVNEAQVDLRALEREAATERDRLRDYQRNFQEAASRKENNYTPVNARIISFASLPSQPYFPKVLPFSTAGALATLILSVVFLMTHALLTGRALKAVGPESHYDKTEPALGSSLVAPPTMASQRTTPHVHPLAANDTPLDQGFYSVGMASTVLGSLGSGRIAIVSPTGDQGSQFVASLARELTADGKSVLVIDLSHDGISTNQMLGRLDLKGVREVLAGASPFRETIYKDQQSTAHIMPTGHLTPGDNNAALQRLSLIVDALDQQYSFLILDCGFTTPKGLVQITKPDSAILVSALGATKEVVDTMSKDIEAMGLPEVIAVMPNPISNKPLAA